ncbi:MAG: hypothetical protein K9M57_02955 [Phycisphaerae bacterium]|nr:hypothetical protein [Phycisphaerae bacterium]
MAKKKTKKKAAKKKVVTKKKAVQRDVLVVASKVKAYIKEKGYMCSADAIQTISEEVYSCIDAAVKRTDANRRSTVKPQDI